LFKLQERAQELQKTAEIRDFDLKKTCEAYDVAHLDLLRARDEQARLSDDQVKQQRSLDSKAAEKLDLSKRLEQEQSRNRMLTA
jgi:hypothetical protein